MNALIRRALLVSSTAVIALAVLPAIGAMAPASFSAYVDQQAQARGGDDDGDDSSDDSGSDDRGSDDSGRDSSSDNDDSSDDSSGRDRDRDRDRGGDDDDSDDSYDDSDDRDDDDSVDDDDSNDDNGKGRGRGGNRNRDEIRLIVNDGQLQGLLSGSMIAVDQNGKRLGFEVEQEHGNTEIKLRAPKGTLTGVTVIPSP